MYAATEADADVINMSLGGYDPKNRQVKWWSTNYVSLFNRALNFAAQQGVTVVCAAMNRAINLNHDCDWMVFPAGCAQSMAISATAPINQQNFDTPAFYTNYGSSVIDVAAPGGNLDFSNPNYLDLIVSCVPLWKNPSGFFWNGGTGASAPHVSGVAALIIGQHGGDMQPAQVTSIRNARKDLIVVVEDD